MRAATFALAAALLALPAMAQEALVLAPGQTLRFHAAPGPERPVSAAYTLQLEAGEWLAVNAPAAIVDGAGTEPAIVLTGPKGQEIRDVGRLVRRIAAGGSWRLAVRDFHALSVSRYPAGHPVVETGVAPGEVRLDPRGLGPVAVVEEPMDLHYADVPPPSGWPARLAITVGERMTIHLYRRAGLRQMELWPHDPTRNLAALLAGGEALEAGLALPMFPLGEYFVAFTAQAERVRGACFTYLRYVASWTQEQVFPFDKLTYVALGLSRDGAWFAVATAPVAHAPVAGQPATVREGQSAEYEAALTRAIADDPRALSPDLATLDAVIASLAPPCGGR